MSLLLSLPHPLPLPHGQSHVSVIEITFKYKSDHHTLLHWFPITFNIPLCLIFILPHVCQVSWICELMSSISFGNFSSHHLFKYLFSLSSLPHLSPPSLPPLSPFLSFLSPPSWLSSPPPPFSWTPLMLILDDFISFYGSQMTAKYLSSSKISEICLYSTAKPSASWALDDPSLYSLLPTFEFTRVFSLLSHLTSMLWEISCSHSSLLIASGGWKLPYALWSMSAFSFLSILLLTPLTHLPHLRVHVHEELFPALLPYP